ncbi:hypothetical protein OG194_29605 [Streptomyces sp. NBC_01288]|uniref:hypothetical protein n=1 Tax=Streptomyces sp. NBC_01288 TaxID=2903814 RepID=UPI002E12BE72|nr:hypothetical protein OG194_29605 [Streptomyces sp. NBC_01288]
MRRIRVLEAIAGSDFSWAPGDVVEVSEEEAASWADGHRAVLADDGQEQGGEPQPSAVHQEPLVVGEDGEPLEVLASTLEEIEPSGGVEGGPRWVRWSVTVRLPVPVVPDDEQPAVPEDPADLENEDPEQEPAEVPATATPFDPVEHTNKQVLAYLDTVGEQEALRVLDLEVLGENRAGIGKNREQVLEAARARDAASGDSQTGAEQAADYSRGGGGEPSPETRSW